MNPLHGVLLLLGIAHSTSSHDSARREAGDSLSQNVSRLLNSLLDGYDKRLRPDYGRRPIEIGVTLHIVSVSSISEANMDFTLDFYFRQLWVDRRLAYSAIAEELIISSEMIHSIWSPDTFFPEEKSAYFHLATSRNEFLRIRPNGHVLYSMRITVTSSCPMDFRNFPMDRQVCTLAVETFGYQQKDITYKWDEGSKTSVRVSSKVSMPQFRLTDYRVRETQVELTTGNYSGLALDMLFVRSLGYYVIQVYVPTILIVVISWISFWLHRSVAPARVALGITTVLTMTTLISSTNASLPKISYLKSIDVYLVTCFLMVFAALLEFACVFYLSNRCDKHHKKVKAKAKTEQEKAKAEQEKAKAEQEKAKAEQEKAKAEQEKAKVEQEKAKSNADKSTCHCELYQRLLLQRRSVEDDIEWRRRDSLLANTLLDHYEAPVRHRVMGTCSNAFDSLRDHVTKRQASSEASIDGVRVIRPPSADPLVLPADEPVPAADCSCCIKSTDIDNYSRVIFPLCFVCFNIVYWFTYLSIDEETLPNHS